MSVPVLLSARATRPWYRDGVRSHLCCRSLRGRGTSLGAFRGRVRGSISRHKVQNPGRLPDSTTSFLDPQRVPSVSYQVENSKMAIGSGGSWARAPIVGDFGDLGYLPEDRTDFIFANLAEKVGFVGSVVVLTFSSCWSGACCTPRRSRATASACSSQLGWRRCLRSTRS